MTKSNLLIFISCMLLGCSHICAQAIDKQHLSIGARGRYSHVLDGHNIYGTLIDSHNFCTFDATVGFSTRPEDGRWFDRAFNYPTFGLGLSYARLSTLDFKGDSRLGDIVNLYGWSEFNFIRTKHFKFGPLLELGLAFSGEIYDYNTNRNNTFIGSKVFAVFGTGLHAEWLFSPHWELQAGVYLTHHSNGMTRSPNLGINELAVGLGVRHYLSHHTNSTKQAEAPERPKYKKGLNWNVFAAAGVHSCPTELDGILVSDNPSRLAPARFCGLVAGETVWRYHPIFGTGIGIEMDYNANNYRQTDFLLTGKEDPNGYSSFRVGMYLKQEFWYRRISVHVAAGVYLFKRCGLTEDVSTTFEKIGIRYHFGKQKGLFAGLDLHAHQFDRSYALEWSLGYGF